MQSVAFDVFARTPFDCQLPKNRCRETDWNCSCQHYPDPDSTTLAILNSLQPVYVSAHAWPRKASRPALRALPWTLWGRLHAFGTGHTQHCFLMTLFDPITMGCRQQQNSKVRRTSCRSHIPWRPVPWCARPYSSPDVPSLRAVPVVA